MKGFLSTKLHIPLLGLILFCSAIPLSCQNKDKSLEIERFRDSAHHWYDIKDDERVINPLDDKPQYEPTEFVKIADNIILHQKSNGGWLKNYDMRAILTDDQVKKLVEDKDNISTTFDNGATHSQLTYLAEVYTLTKDETYKNAFVKGLEFVFAAQYENGGWPQTYPGKRGYHKYITFNDGAMPGIMNLLYLVVSRDTNYLFVDEALQARAKKSYDKGIECILNCQIIEDSVKKVWCQQHDNITLKPQDARTFEKASLCSQESAQITRILMRVEKPTERISEAIESAVNWFKDMEINGIKMKWIKSTEEEFLFHKTSYDRIVVEDESAPRIWARFYELETGRPIFCGRDGVIKYSMMEIGRDRRTGYGWYTYEPEEVYREYEIWKAKFTKKGK